MKIKIKNKQEDVQFIRVFPLPKGVLSVKEQQVFAKLQHAVELVSPLYQSQINDDFPGANFYPHDVSKKEILMEADGNPLILNPYTIVEKNSLGQLEAIPYHIKYKEPLKKIISLIREAAKITDNKDFAKRLELQADALENGTYDAAEIYWLSMKPYKISFIIGPAERYEDRLFFKKTCYSAVLGVMDEKATDEAVIIRDAILSVQRKAFSLSQKIEIANRIKARVDNTVVLAGLDARASFQAAFLPVDPNLIDKYGGEVIIFSSMQRFNFGIKVLPVFKQIFEKRFQESYPDENLIKASQKLSLIRMISIGLTKYLDAEVRLGDLYPSINEIASYLLAFKNAGSLFLKDIISQKELEAMMIAFICRALHSRQESVAVKSLTPYTKGYTLTINYLLKSGAIKTLDGNYWINFTKMFVAVNELTIAIEKLQAFGDRQDVERLLDEYGNNPI